MSPPKSGLRERHAYPFSVAYLGKCSGGSRFWLVRAITTNWKSYLTFVAPPPTTTCQALDNFPERKASNHDRGLVTSAIASPSKSTWPYVLLVSDGASDDVIDTDKVLSLSSENSYDWTGRGASMRLMHLSTHICIPLRSRRSLANCPSWRRATSLTEESFMTARLPYLLHQRVGLSDAGHSRMTELEIPVSIATIFTVGATA